MFANENRLEDFDQILARMYAFMPSEKLAMLAADLQLELEKLVADEDPEVQDKLVDVFVNF